jgi:hypothetical protein
MEKIYGSDIVEFNRNGFSFSVNDLTGYCDLKDAISNLGQSLLDMAQFVKDPLNRTREDIRICKDVWQNQQLGITDLMRFCKNLYLDREFIDSEVRQVNQSLENITAIFYDPTNPVVVCAILSVQSI